MVQIQVILRREEVQRLTGLPRSTIYARIQQGTFPKPIKISEKSVGWLENEIAEWQQARIKVRDGT